MVEKLRHPLNIALGTALSAILAVLASMLFARSTWRGLLPLAFVAIVLLLAKRFGVAVGLTGSVAAAVVFAVMLYAPLRSPRIEDDTARMSLGWMIVGSVALSYLLYPSSHAVSSRRRNNRH